ncbi:ABC transporter ATP-binding protein [Mesorhizobium sp. DCY119]|uniref:ABC transporter ATP-binding protein n=1 Tax=Mesorhizobium sp. DCY119 TaxID=2108445 RepID=UPI001FDEFE04|nr:ABC transporter ATP-binding protein [Mesorhizobium sp. DCY119]
MQVVDLNVEYQNPLRTGTAVDGLSFDIARGEALALVGESGCGKSTTALSLLKLLPSDTRITGSAAFHGRDLVSATDLEMQDVRGREIGIVFQEPMTSLNPVYRIGWQIGEVLRRHLGISRSEARNRTLELLEHVALPDAARKIDAYPHELSGGQRQRVMIAMAIALKPQLLIADEPTTALDASVREQILGLIDRLRRELNMAVLLISHDLPLVSRWTDRVIIMHHGKAMEALPSPDLFTAGRHPYTRGLIGASIRLDDGKRYDRARLAEVQAVRKPDGEFDFTLKQAVSATTGMLPTAGPALTVRDLVVQYGGSRAVDGVSFTIPKGHTLGLVGESGCGKSSLSRAIMGLVRPASGEIVLGEDPLSGLSSRAMRPHRKRLQMVFQDPFASLNPRHSVGTILSGVLQANGVSSSVERHRRIRETLDQVGLAYNSIHRLPHEFSGGQRQRIAIARALILRPELIICDEPTSALDVSVQAQILNLLADLKHELGLTYLFISHDLAIVRYISDEVMVMRSGKILERGSTETIWEAPNHEYTRTLIAAAA